MSREASTHTSINSTNHPLSQGSILQRKCTSCGQHKMSGGICNQCTKEKSPNSATVTPLKMSRDFSQIPITSNAAPAPIQPKLVVGHPNDKYEQEADRVAEKVMRMPEPQVQRQAEPTDRGITIQRISAEKEEDIVQTKPAEGVVQRKCAACEEEETLQRTEMEEEEETLQTKSEGGGVPAVTPSIQSGIGQLRQGGGTALPASTRSFMEPRFGHDFSNVKIHAGSQAANLSKSVNARAFTVGQDIFFNRGEFQPNSFGGMQLLAHELTHTLQQSPKIIQRKGENVPGSQAVFDFAQLIINGAFSSSEFAEALAAEDFTTLQLRDLKERVLDLQTTSDPLVDSALEEIDNILAGRTDLDKVEFVPTPCEAGESASVNAEAWTANERLFGIAEGTEAPLKKGDQGEAVRLVQQALLQWGCEYSEESVNLLPRYRDDGDFGREMKLGVQEFQKRNGLSKDGVVGSDTLFNLQEKVILQSILDEEEAAAQAELDRRSEEEEEELEQKSKVELYRQYLEYKNKHKAEIGGYLGMGSNFMEEIERHNNLKEEIKNQGFDSIRDYEKYLDRVVYGFQDDARSLALKYLEDYESFLEQEANRYDSQEELTALWLDISDLRDIATELRSFEEQIEEYYSEAEEPQSSVDGPTPPPDMPGEMPDYDAAKTDYEDERKNVAEAHPLLAQKDFPIYQLTDKSRKNLEKVIPEYIASKKEQIAEATQKLEDESNYELVFELDNLVEVAKAQLGIDSNSVESLIIQEKIRQVKQLETLKSIAIAIGSLIGTAIAFALSGPLGAGAFAIAAGVFEVKSELDNYEDQLLFNNLQLLSTRPDFGWVVLAVLGVVLEIGAVGKLAAVSLKSSAKVRRAHDAVEAIDKSGLIQKFNKNEIDISELERQLYGIKEVDDDIRSAIIQEAGKRKNEFGALTDDINDFIRIDHLPGRHSLKYAKNGDVYLCSPPPCRNVTDFINQYPKLIREKWIEKRLSKIADVDNDKTVQKLLSALEDDIKFIGTTHRPKHINVLRGIKENVDTKLLERIFKERIELVKEAGDRSWGRNIAAALVKTNDGKIEIWIARNNPGGLHSEAKLINKIDSEGAIGIQLYSERIPCIEHGCRLGSLNKFSEVYYGIDPVKVYGFPTKDARNAEALKILYGKKP